MAINREVRRVEQELYEWVTERLDAQSEAIIRAWVEAWEEVEAEVESALYELVAAAANGRVTRTQMLRSQRLQAALGRMADALERAVGRQVEILTADLMADIRRVADAEAAMLAAQLPAAITAATTLPVSTAVVGASSDQIAAMVRRATEQITKVSYPISVEAYTAIRRQLLRGITVGSNPRTVARRAVQAVEGQFHGGLSRALTIARTEMLDAHRAAGQAVEERNPDLVSEWVWEAHLGPRTCRACLAMHGQRFPTSTPGPQGHQNCVLPGAVVSGPRAVASTTRWFDGDVIDIETLSGRVLSVTPNHPILTPHGWVAAGDLREGGDVIAGTWPDGISALGRPDDHQVPALIEDVAQTLGGAAPVEAVSVPTAPEDFHGDGAGSDVHVVRTHRPLRHNDEATGAQQVGQLKFLLGNVSLEAFARSGNAGTMFWRLLGAAYRIMGRSYPGRVLFGSSLGHHESVGVSVAPDRHTCGIEPVLNGLPGDAECVGEGVHGLSAAISLDDFGGRNIGLGGEVRAGFGRGEGVSSGFVAPESTLHQSGLESRFAYPIPASGDLAAFAGDIIADRIVKIGRRRWSGHVYNLQTDTGWYLANGIITHNCRCARVPVAKTWAELGFAGIRERPSLHRSSEAYFNRLSESNQRAILGNAGFEAWKRGDYPMSEWVNRQDNPGWRPSYVATTPPRQPALTS